jgi:hypothetical protein
MMMRSGSHVGIEETLENSLCAELVDEAHHGMTFGVLATVNGIGDFLSSAIVGLLWSVAGTLDDHHSYSIETRAASSRRHA